MAAIVLGFEAVVIALATPVMIQIADVRRSIALAVCLGLAALAVLAAGLLRTRFGYLLGTLIQFAAIGLGFVVPVMFVLGFLFAGFWVMVLILGHRLERAKRRAMERGPEGVNGALG